MSSECVGFPISRYLSNRDAVVWEKDEQGNGGTIFFPSIEICTHEEYSSVEKVERYCPSITKAQQEKLRRWGICSVHDLLDVVRAEDAKRASNSPIHDAVYKKSLIHFLNNKCDGLYLDFTQLYKYGIVERGGKFPDQWIRPQSNAGMSEANATIAALLRSVGLD